MYSYDRNVQSYVVYDYAGGSKVLIILKTVYLIMLRTLYTCCGVHLVDISLLPHVLSREDRACETAVMKALFKKPTTAESPQHPELHTEPLTDSNETQSDSELPAQKAPHTPTQVRAVLCMLHL